MRMIIRAASAGVMVCVLMSAQATAQGEVSAGQSSVRDWQQLMLTKSLRVLQAQRDDANNREVNALARASALEDEVAVLRKRITELEAKAKQDAKPEAPKPDEGK